MSLELTVEALGPSASAVGLRELIHRAAQSTSSVLITGEPGLGQESVALAVHRQSHRQDRPFVTLNCAGLSEISLEVELFGQVDVVRRSLLEEARGGTLFLDEISELGLPLQGKITQLIRQQALFDVRVITSTHRDLVRLVELGHFKESLYCALAVLPIHLTPLRQRSEDIPAIADHFLNKYSALNGHRVRGFCPQAIEKLKSINWSGNIRELESVVERLTVLSPQTEIQASDVPDLGLKCFESFFGKETSDLPPLEELERRYIQMVLQRTGSHKEKAAQILGINRRTLYRKEREYGIIDPEPAT